MLNTEMLTKVSYLNLLEESDISFTEIDLIPEIDYSGVFCFKFEDKNIESSCIKVKAYSDEDYPYSIEHELEFEDCNINDLSILIENYLGGFRLSNCKIETLTIYKPKDRSLPEISFESTRAKVINIIETEAIDKKREESRLESKRLTLNFRTETRDQEESNYNIINSIIYTGYDTKNRLKIISKLYTNTLIENLYLNNVSYDDISIEDQIVTDKVSQSEFIINNIYLDNVTFTEKRNLVYRNIRINPKELVGWVPLRQKLSKLTSKARRSDYPRHDIVNISLLTTALTELLSCNLNDTDFEIQNLNLLGMYPINESSSGIIQLLKRTKDTGQKTVNSILGAFEQKFDRNIVRTLSHEISNKHNSKITLYPEDIDHINSCISKVLKSVTGLDLNVVAELNSKGEVNVLNIDSIPKEYTITPDHWLKGISGLRQNGPIRNTANEVRIDPNQVVSFNRRSITNPNFAELEAQMRNWRMEVNRRELDSTAVVLDSMRTTNTNNRPVIQSRQRRDNQPVFRVTPALREALSEPEVTPNNFDPAFLDNRTQARQVPIETEEPQNSNPMSFRDAAEMYRDDTTAISNALSIEEAMNREVLNFNSQYYTQFTTTIPEEHLTAREIVERQRRESRSQEIVNAYEHMLSGGYSISDWDTQNITNFENHFMPRDPISSLQMNVENGTMRSNTESLDINIFSNSDDED